MSEVAGYVALSRMPGHSGILDGHTALLAARKSAELGGCRWCIDRADHDCRRAGIPPDWSGDERHHAAMQFVAALAGMKGKGDVNPQILHRAQRVLSAAALAELTRIVAEHHCLEP